MSFLSKLFKRKSDSGKVARNRLQILLEHEHLSQAGGKDKLLEQLHKEIMEVIRRHLPIEQDKVNIKMDKHAQYSTLAIDVEVPSEHAEKKDIGDKKSEDDKKEQDKKD